MKVFKYVEFGEYGDKERESNKYAARELLERKRSGENIPVADIRKIYQGNLTIDDVPWLQKYVTGNNAGGRIVVNDNKVGAIPLQASAAYAANMQKGSPNLYVPSYDFEGKETHTEGDPNIIAHEYKHLQDAEEQPGISALLRNDTPLSLPLRDLNGGRRRGNKATTIYNDSHTEQAFYNKDKIARLRHLREGATPTQKERINKILKKLENDHKTYYNRTSLLERRADTSALKDKNLEARINYLRTLRELPASSVDHIAPNPEQKASSISLDAIQGSFLSPKEFKNYKANPELYKRFERRFGDLPTMDQLSFLGALRHGSVEEGVLKPQTNSAAYLPVREMLNQKAASPDGTINMPSVESYEPMRVKNIIRNSFNDLTRNSTNPNKARAEIAKKWIESGVLGPQLTRNMQGLVDHYNNTGEWFGYFSRAR